MSVAFDNKVVLTDDVAFGNVAFGNVAFGNMVAKTDDTAFGNEIAQTDDRFVIVEATRTSASPHSKQINLGLLWGPHKKSYAHSPPNKANSPVASRSVTRLHE